MLGGSDLAVTGEWTARRGRHRLPGPASAPWADGGASPRRGAASGRRLDWLDAGRGVAIVLVVLLHACDWLKTGGLDEHPWSVVNNVLAGLRMPLFFTVSGLLGARWVTRSWRELLSDKVTVLVWVYLAWQPIGLLAATVADRFTGHHQTLTHFVVALAVTVVRPRSELWFLWALSLYFVLARATAGVRGPVQLAVAATVSAICLSSFFPESTLGWFGPPKFYVFFLVGMHHRAVLIWFAQRARRARSASAALLLVWALATVVAVRSGIDLVIGVGLVLRVLGLAAGLSVAVLLGGSRLLRYLGARTLPIYLAHTPFVIALTWLVQPLRHEGLARAVVLALPLVLTVVAVVLSLLLHQALRRTVTRYLYAPPSSLQAAVARIAAGCRPAVIDLRAFSS